MGSGTGWVQGRPPAPRLPGPLHPVDAVTAVKQGWARGAGEVGRAPWIGEWMFGCPVLLLLPRTLESHPLSRIWSESGEQREFSCSRTAGIPRALHPLKHTGV